VTDYSVADDVAAAFAEARPLLAGAFHADTYQVVRDVATADGYGGSTIVSSTLESGRCSLNVSQRMGGEGISAGQVLPLSLYTAELPITSIVAESDRLTINGRPFSVTDVKRGGLTDLFTVVELEER